jgi:O-antigen ligase
MISLYGLKVHRSFYLRGAWLAGLGGAGYSLYLTQSRGGFLALAASLVTWGWLRFGKRKGLLASAVALFGLLVIFGGRQTTFNLYQGTAKGRIQLWADSLALFLKNPLFGAGKDLVEQVAGQVTHNAFLQSFAELGVFGGTLFVGAWYLGLKGLYSWRPAGLEPRDLDLGELRLCLLPALVGYAVGLLSLSFIYVSPTYLVLGLATAFIVLGEQAGGWQGDRLQVKLLFRLVILSAVVLVAIYFFTRFTVDWGV